MPHIRVSGFAWFCRHCWQDMPVFYQQNPVYLEKAFPDNLAEKVQPTENNIIYPGKGQTITGWIGVQDVPA
ncbi:hypothetical protein PN465_03260 [Nodularia spumigena CS-584]|uniref:Uncharacterized protein n=1 Tax=Nodularia spumigena UHCC 0060 TaxID=3110300 RepID=A0ABU5USZ5_NODSP|nr:hypothetical protein [Nodularia spumigena]MEA5615768.1 hypothetical protein [Nodularia spumigena UHCC 0040]MDB9381260.1 hypothetical protein [Nodularia spumigena CS-584]MEA5526282.1 hypothetical protein [Nodularia spumigena UHCC 0143]MEA5556741.1 hypothetical protein [Nodularia spumigena CH309]MEA5609424.1 hypothetical protein [Nodularia spumigena UHCC 0060]